MIAKRKFTKTAKFSIPSKDGKKKMQRTFEFNIGDRVLSSYEIFQIIKKLHGFGMADFEIEKSEGMPYYTIEELMSLIERYWNNIQKIRGVTTLSKDENRLLKAIALLVIDKFEEGFNVGVEEVKGKVKRMRAKSSKIKDPNDKAMFKELMDEALAQSFRYDIR